MPHACEAFVSDMIEMLQSHLGIGDLELHTDLPTDAWARYGVFQRAQAGGDLGDRVLLALTEAFANGRTQVMVLGSDAPTLPASLALQLLLSQADVALGPAQDGGYYAISCRRVHPRMFQRVSWSGPAALETTARAARECGMTVKIGSPWFDVDTPDDLDRLFKTEDLPRHTASWYKSWLRTSAANRGGPASKG